MQPAAASDEGRFTGISILTAATPLVPAEPNTRCADVYQRFRGNPDLMAVPVVDGGRPIGLVNRHDLLTSLAHDYGRALYAKKPIVAQMDAQPLIVESDVTTEALEWMIAVNRPSALIRGFIVVQEGQYVGVGNALTLLQLSMASAEERNRQLEETRKAAEAANRAKSDFLATMSHELRTPLNAIIGFSDMMANEIHGPIGQPQYLGYLQDIHSSGNALLALINDILDTAKIDSGKMELFDEPIDVVELVTAALRMLAPRALAAGVRLDTRMPPATPGLFADRRAVKQILLNLVDNAIKFSPKREVAVAFEAHSHDGFALVVADTGIGMTPTELEIALSPFGQVANQHTRSHHGSGLGLPLVRSLAQLHGARFAIASEPGVGTTVTITFPPSRVLRLDEMTEAETPALRLAHG